MQTVVVQGRFINQGDGSPHQGCIDFQPGKLWVEEFGIAYATMSYHNELKDGIFIARLTPTHGHDSKLPWYYTVKCPVGQWSIQIPESEEPIMLQDLLPAQFRPKTP